MDDEPIIALEPAAAPPPAPPHTAPPRAVTADDLGGWRWAGAGPRPGGRKWRLVPIALAVLIGAVGVPLSAGAGGVLPRGVQPAGWSLTIAGFVACVAVALFRRRPLVTIEVYQYGLTYADGGIRRSVRWADVTTVTEHRSAVLNALGEPIEREHTFRFRCADGTEHTLELGDVAETEQLAGYVYEGTLEVLLPRAEQRLAAGRPAEFGPLVLTPVGLVRGASVLEWGQVAGVERADGRLVISRKGDGAGPWYEGYDRDVPNLHLLLALIQAQFRRRDGGRASSRYSLLDRYQLVEGAPRLEY